MAQINLLPQNLRNYKPPKIKKEKGASPRPAVSAMLKLAVFIPILLAALCALAFGFLFIEAKNKEKTLVQLNEKMKAFGGNYQRIDELSKQKKDLEEKMASYRNIAQSSVSWSQVLSALNKIIPKQIWLHSITTEIDAAKNKTMTLRGSATSLAEAQIISAISQFVSSLKENELFKQNFQDVRLGPLRAEKKGNFTVMNFSLTCRFK